jgi:XTP/dITP diphosphohydrolase
MEGAKMKLVIATGNEHKVREIKDKFKKLDLDIISMKEAGVNISIEETGSTFMENALIKAKEVSNHTKLPVMADDSGIEIDYLHKKPGIYSARFAGEDTSYTIKNRAITDLLLDVPFEERTARYVCAMVVVFPEKNDIKAIETVEGHIWYENLGENGFGYDPIFYLKDYKKTFGQLSLEIKNAISHRAKALSVIEKKLRESI